MQRILKWLGAGLGAVVFLLLIAATYVWIAGGRVVNRVYAQPDSSFVSDPEAADLEEGRRAARLRGCFDGCHGEGLGGNVWFDNLLMGRVVAPDLTRAFAEMSDEELDRSIRQGVRRDGKSLMLMPSSMLHHLSDTDFNNIVAFIRSHEPGQGPDTVMQPGLVARFFILKFGFKPHAQKIVEEGPWLADDAPLGKYLAITVCSECHGMDLRGEEGSGAPNLALVVAYSLPDFSRLMREGVPIGNRELELMKEVAVGRFSHFSDEEIEALHAYLVTLASDPQPSPAD